MKIDEKLVKEIAALNSAIIFEYGIMDLVNGFDYSDTTIHDPYLDESGTSSVDPVAYYGQAFLESRFVTDPVNLLQETQETSTTLRQLREQINQESELV